MTPELSEAPWDIYLMAYMVLQLEVRTTKHPKIADNRTGLRPTPTAHCTEHRRSWRPDRPRRPHIFLPRWV